jgi:hypothetical protein
LEIKEWIKASGFGSVIRLRQNWSSTDCDFFKAFSDTTTFYFTPLQYYNYNNFFGGGIDSSHLMIPYWPDAFWWGEYKFITRDSIANFSEVSIIRHILSTQSHPFEVSLSIPDTAFVPGKPLLTVVTIKNKTSYQLVAPDSSKVDFLVQVFDGGAKVASYEGAMRDGRRERIWWLPYEKENKRKLKTGESISYIVDLSQRFFELSSFSYGSQRTLKVNALLNYYLIPLYGHSVRSDTLSVPFSVINSVEPTALPTKFQLHQNYPNPFNPSTTISYGLPVRSHVTLKIFNVLGQEVAALVSGPLEAGRYLVQWDAKGVASGVYLYRLQAGRLIETKKMMLMR